MPEPPDPFALQPDLHPGQADLARYLRGESARAEQRALERHLAGCPDCQGALDALPLPAGGATVRWQGHRFAARRAAREQAAERWKSLGGVLGALGPIIAAVSRGELAELLAADEIHRRALIRDDPRFGSVALSALLTARCRAVWAFDPAAGVEPAKLAVLIAERAAAAGEAEAAMAAGARAMALMHLGSACRLAASARRMLPSLALAEEVENAEETAVRELPPPPGLAAEAAAALWEMRDGFLDRGQGIDAARVCLDLAALYLRDGREDDLRRMVDDSLPLLTERGAEPAALAALRSLRGAEARGGRPLTLDLIEKIAAALEEARHDPRR